MKKQQNKPLARIAAAAVLMLCGAAWAQSIPRVAELTQDPWNFDSAAWEKGLKFADFKVPGDRSAASQKSEVRVAHDGVSLFVRFTALDTQVAALKPGPLDEFGDRFPQGDHAEIWNTLRGTQVYAFDPAGNKYDAAGYDKKFMSGFRVKSRVTKEGWQSVVVIPLRALYRPELGSFLHLSFVRHLPRSGQPAERSTATGQPEVERPRYTLE